MPFWTSCTFGRFPCSPEPGLKKVAAERTCLAAFLGRKRFTLGRRVSCVSFWKRGLYWSSGFSLMLRVLPGRPSLRAGISSHPLHAPRPPFPNRCDTAQGWVWGRQAGWLHDEPPKNKQTKINVFTMEVIWAHCRKHEHEESEKHPETVTLYVPPRAYF